MARGKMVNALTLAAKFIAALPARETPEMTDGTDGFIHLYDMSGTASQATLKFILRDFEMDGLAAKGALLQSLAATLQASEPRATILVETRKQYRNMRYWLEKDMGPVDLARQAAHDLGIDPVSVPIRGGTDGSRLTEMGVPCPNLFTGMQDIHGPLEWISVQDMAPRHPALPWHRARGQREKGVSVPISPYHKPGFYDDALSRGRHRDIVGGRWDETRPRRDGAVAGCGAFAPPPPS